MLTESFGRFTTENHSGRDKQVPAVKDCRFTQTAFGTVVHDSSGKWLGQYETEDAAVEMLREKAKDIEGTTMKYEGYKIGPVIRDIRKDKGLLIEEVAAKTGISVSTLGQVEQGGRNLSMKNLYMLMEVYETDANSLLAIECTPDSLDSRLKRLPADKQDYLKKTFDFMIEQALKSA